MGRTELAQCYFPYIQPKSAWEKLSLEDVRKCYGYDKDTAVYTRIRRLTDNGIAERIQTGEDKGKYKKVVKMLV